MLFVDVLYPHPFLSKTFSTEKAWAHLEPFCVCVQIMCKVVTMLSKDTVEHLLLPRFCDLCSDARLFQVRKVTHFAFSILLWDSLYIYAVMVCGHFGGIFVINMQVRLISVLRIRWRRKSLWNVYSPMTGANFERIQMQILLFLSTPYILGLRSQFWRVLFNCGSGGHRKTTGKDF